MVGGTHIVDVGDELPLGRVPRLLLGSPQPRLDVEQLYLQVGAFCIPAGGTIDGPNDYS